MNNLRNYDSESQYCCNIHPFHVITGICSLCLKERLFILASSSASSSPKTGMYSLGSKTVLQKVSALSNSFLHRLNSGRQRKFYSSDRDSSFSSQEDSFISIKFGDDGGTSWEKGKENLKPASSMKDLKLSSKIDNHKFMNMMNKQQMINSRVVEHKSPRGGMLKWRKRVDQLFQLVRLKSRSSMANVCHVSGSKLEGVKIRNKQGWIKSTLTKRRKKKRGHETKGEL